MSIFRHEKPSIEESERRLGERISECLTLLSNEVPDDFEAKRYAALADGLKKAARGLYACENAARDLAWRTRMNRK